MSASLPRRIVYSQAIRERLKELAHLAILQGKLQAFRNALETIHERLQIRLLPPSEHPEVFGEPRFHLPNLDMMVCVAVVAPLAVNFGVGLQAQTLGQDTFTGIYVLSVHFLETGDH